MPDEPDFIDPDDPLAAATGCLNAVLIMLCVIAAVVLVVVVVGTWL